MRGAPMSFGPGLLAREKRRRISQARGHDQALESRQPMVIVSRAVVRLTATGGGLEFIGERGRPFLPGEIPLLRELDRERESLGLPRLGKHRPLRVAR